MLRCVMALAEVGGAVAARHSPPATHTTPGARQRVLVERGPLRRGGDRTALSGSARALMQPHPGGVTRPSSTSSPAFLVDVEPPRRAPPPLSVGFRQQRKPLRGAPEGLPCGPAPGLETRYRRRSHSSYRDTGPETGFGGGELTRRRWRSLQRGPDRPTAPLSHHRNSRGW